jgi:hypothetical protein
MMPTTLFRSLRFFAFWCGSSALWAQTSLPDFVVTGARVANDDAVGALTTPVSALRFEPRVDVQARNLAEAQADVAIRGGHFENTGFRLGAANLADPQTGHYAAELPVSPLMLSTARVETGLANALHGLNAGVGTVAFDWRPINDRAEISAAAGSDGFNRQSVYGAAARPIHGVVVAADAEWARSEGQGSISGGDHHFERSAWRGQVRGDATQTDLFVGYQKKFFGWPNLYTPFGFNESENLQTVLALLNHRWADQAGNVVNAAAFYRRNKDDYEFNRAVPGASNPFQHTTWVRGLAIDGRLVAGPTTSLHLGAEVSADKIQSTSLTFGRYSSRTMSKLTLAPEHTVATSRGEIVVQAGASFDDSNREVSAVNPLLGVEWRTVRGTVYAEYSTASQVASYTALNSSATAGLFRGNPNLGRAYSRNLEFGFRGEVRGWRLEAAAFVRSDDDLVDWTFRRGVTARTANAVDVRTSGMELVAARRTEHWELVVGYSWLEKSADYGTSLVDASFYALNFPRHRVTAALTARLGAGFELRSDNEYRVQEANPLRVLGGDSAFLSSLGLYYTPPAAKRWQLSARVDNLWDDDFQDVPAVPAAPRQWMAGATWRW